MHCNATSVTEPAKANPPYTHMRLLQELHVLHTEACRKAIHGRGLLSRHHLLNHSSLNMHKSFKGNNGALFFFTTPSQLLHNFQSFNTRTIFGLFWDISFKHFLNHSSLNMQKLSTAIMALFSSSLDCKQYESLSRLRCIFGRRVT